LEVVLTKCQLNARLEELIRKTYNSYKLSLCSDKDYHY